MSRVTRKLLAKGVFTAALAAVLFGATSHSTTAHARLVWSSPVSGSALDALPNSITLEFSEAVVIESVHLTLELAGGGAIALASPVPAGSDRSVTVTVVVPGDMPGTYQLRWSVKSAADGHNSAGLIVFTAGTGRTPAISASAGSERDPWWLIAVRVIWLLALAVIASRVIAAFSLRSRPGTACGLLAGSIAFAAAFATMRPWADFDAASDSVRWLTVAGGFGLLAGAGAWRRGRSAVALSATAWAVSIIGLAASGHAAGDLRAITATVVHLALALVWIGALLALLLNLNGERLHRDLSTYSRAAIIGVPVLGLAGIVLSAVGISDQRTLTDSAYGRTLLIKLAVVALVLAIAATNRWVTLRWMNRQPNKTQLDSQSRWVLLLEIGLLAVVIALAGALSGIAPPGEAALVPVASPLRVIEQQVTVDDLSIQLAARITGEVDDRFTVTVFDGNGQPSAGIQRAIISTSYFDPATGRVVTGERFDADPISPGRGEYGFNALRLSRLALWSVDLTIRRNGRLDVVHAFEVDTRSWIVEQPRIANRVWRWPVVPVGAWALLAAAVLLQGAGALLIRRNGQVAPISGAILLVALGMIGTGFTVQAWQRSAERTGGHDLVAPAAPDLIAARANYETRCLACHGSNGAGLDVVDPLHQHGSGTDLLDPRTATLSDGDLFTLISNGVGDSDMPAFDLALTTEQRWNLVAYLRSLQESSEGSGSSR